MDFDYEATKDFLARTGFDACGSVLDVGCANGYFLSRLASDFKNKKYTGIDLKEEYIKDGCERFKNLIGSGFNLLSGDVNEFVFNADQKYDAIVARLSLIHMLDLEDVLKKLKSLLAKNGKLWIFDINCNKTMCEPHHKAYDAILRAIKKGFEDMQIELNFTETLMPKLNKRGFKNIIKETDPTSNQTIPIKLYQDYLRNDVHLYYHMLPGSYTDDDVKEVEAFITHELPKKETLFKLGLEFICAKNE